MRELLLSGLTEMGLEASERALERLERYAELLLEKNRVMNLTAIVEPEQVGRLHFLDSAGVLAYGGPGGWLAGKAVIDVGTGAGFPGMVLKILEPSLRLTLLDSMGKRIVWLRQVCDELGLDGVECVQGRAEELGLRAGYRNRFDAAVSRAVAALPQLAELCLPFVRSGGAFFAMKSVGTEEEIREGQRAIARLGGDGAEIRDYPVPGTGIVHRLVKVGKLANTPKGFPRAWGKIKRSPL